MSEILMPAAFIGHGSPMNALENNRHTAAWQAFGKAVPRPRAILMVSAHWHINATAVTAMARPRTIHDFGGFPPELFAMQYPAPGLPELVGEIAELVQPDIIDTVYADSEHWGLDHGTWSVLCHAFPDADIPVVQLSLNASKPAAYHVQMGAALAALRQRGILVMGSGNVVHNLRVLDWNRPDSGTDWAQRFDEHARELMLGRPGDIAALASHRDYAMAVPTDEHLLPLYYIAGLAAAGGDKVDVLTDGYALGSLSMTAYTVGMPAAA
ncbi:4,5-DOPA dioxygenase extradiol [Stenotrophomonas ginsengisoli]|nr:4,5-DOPA dioxygenase extradiol [Stenotrophomonas ginsengisoli]